MLRGDVEVHVRSQGWKDHGHHKDPRYNRVVLHVVLEQGGGQVSAQRQDGSRVPVAALSHQDASLVHDEPLPPPGVQELLSLDQGTLGLLLDRWGDRRFLRHSALYRRALARVDGQELLYRELLGALGYSQNRSPMKDVGLRMPLRLLRSAALAHPQERRPLVVSGLLLGLRASYPLSARGPGSGSPGPGGAGGS